MPAYIAIVFILGILLGAWMRRSPAEDIDLIEENRKLRKENEVLWRRIKDEGKIR